MTIKENCHYISLPSSLSLSLSLSISLTHIFQESILSKFFLCKKDIFSVFAIKLGPFMIIKLFSYVTKWESLRAKIGEHWKKTQFGRIDSRSWLSKTILHRLKVFFCLSSVFERVFEKKEINKCDSQKGGKRENNKVVKLWAKGGKLFQHQKWFMLEMVERLSTEIFVHYCKFLKLYCTYEAYYNLGMHIHDS